MKYTGQTENAGSQGLQVQSYRKQSKPKCKNGYNSSDFRSTYFIGRTILQTHAFACLSIFATYAVRRAQSKEGCGVSPIYGFHTARD